MLAILLILGLILLGLIFMLVEMLLLPGVTIGALLSIASFVGAIYLAFDALGIVVGVVTIIASITLSLITFFWAIRTGVWKRISLKEQVGGTSSSSPADKVSIGMQGVTISRLSPMGSAKFGDVIIEAKSLDSVIDPKSEVEVVGYDNASVVVKSIKK